VRKFKLFESEFVRMGDDEAVTTVPDIEESKEHNETKKGQSTTTTTTTVLTKTWLLGFPSVDENAEVKEFEDTKEIRERFDDLTKNTDSLLEELNKLQVAKCKKESSEEQTVYATNTRIPYKYTKQVFVSPSNHQRTVVVDKEYPRVSYTKKSINSNPFIDPSDSLGQNTPLVEGYPGFLSPQLGRKTYPGQSCTLPGGGQDKGRTRRLTEEYCYACDEATQTPARNKKKCNIM